MKLFELDELIKTVAPIEGISSDGAIVFLPEATKQEKKDAQALMATHLPSLEII